MKKIVLLLLLLSIGTAQAANLERRPRKNRKAQKENTTSQPATTLSVEESDEENPTQSHHPQAEQDPELSFHRPMPKPATNLSPEQIDSLLAVWRERQALASYETFFNDYINLDSAAMATAAAADTTPDSVYAQRLKDLVSPISLCYNPIVKGYIDRYVRTNTGTISRILGLSQYYFPIIEQELIKSDLPVELRALPIIESALSPTALSPMGALGLWQFMPATGKAYGLEINSLVDERCSPVRSTQAACRYLKDLYNIYHDWTLAIAAYNCGPGNVNKAIARAGGSCRSFWDIYDYLPRETRGYVPAFIGASYAYAYHRLHNIEPTEPPMPLATDTIRVNRLMHLGQIASTLNIPIETLRQLNPQYKIDIVPATTKSYTIVLPQRYVTSYIALQDTIFAKDSTYLKEYINPANLEKKLHEQRVTIHVVKRGDTLGAIARRYRVTTSQLMRWNGIKNPNKLRLGQRLRIEGR